MVSSEAALGADPQAGGCCQEFHDGPPGHVDGLQQAGSVGSIQPLLLEVLLSSQEWATGGVIHLTVKDGRPQVAEHIAQLDDGLRMLLLSQKGLSKASEILNAVLSYQKNMIAPLNKFLITPHSFSTLNHTPSILHSQYFTLHSSLCILQLSVLQ